jgi:hypothetical protein
VERVLKVMITDSSAPSGTLYPMPSRLQRDRRMDSEWQAQREDAGGGGVTRPAPGGTR